MTNAETLIEFANKLGYDVTITVDTDYIDTSVFGSLTKTYLVRGYIFKGKIRRRTGFFSEEQNFETHSLEKLEQELIKVMVS